MSEEGTNHWYRVIIKEGRYREVRRMWDAVGHTVSRLKRVRYGTISLNRDLKRGQVSKIAPMQLEKMVTVVGLHHEFANQLYSGGRSAGAKNAKKASERRLGKQSGGDNSAKPKRGKKTANKAFAGKKTSARTQSKSARFEKTMESGSGSKRASKKTRSRR